MNYRYSPLQRNLKRFYRKFFPVQKSSYTLGYVKDICTVNLVPPEKLKKFFSDCIKLLREEKGQEIGDYLEFGVFNGSSMVSMYLTCKELGINSTRFFGFDAFEGLPAGAENEDAGVYKKGFYTCSFEQMQKCLQKRSIDTQNIHWIKGWYNETLSDDMAKKFNINKLGVVFVDCDTYGSSKTVLDFIGPLLKEPAILCFDDWKLYDLDIKGMGEYKSFNEFLDNHPNLKVKEIKSYNRKSRSFLIKP